MKFVFHPAYDSELPFHTRSLAEGKIPTAELGVIYGGPTSFLRILELHLGLVSVESSPLIRTLEFLGRLEERCKAEKTFYGESLKVDPLGTSRKLLEWRDQLILAGWDGLPKPTSSNRLKELSVLHGLAKVCPRGEADRYLAVLSRLETIPLNFLEIETKIPLTQIRGLLKKVLSKLKVSDRSERDLMPQAKVGTDLHLLQQFLITEATSTKEIKDPAFKNDGTLLIVDAISDTLLARTCTSGLAAWEKDIKLSHTVLAGSSQDTFNIAANAMGLPRLMTGDGDGLRGSGAFLHLLMEMAWNSFDVNLWLRFLNLSPNPLPKSLRVRMSAAIAETPGLGSPGWFGAIDSYLEEEMKAGRTSHSRDNVDSDLKAWLNSSNWQRKEGADKVQVLALFNRVLQWVDQEPALGEEEFCGELKRETSAFLAILDYWFQRKDRIDEKSLAALYRSSQGRGRNPNLGAQASGIQCAEHPVAVMGELDRLLIWNLTDQQKVSLLPWTKSEREALESQGCELPSPFDEIDEKTSGLRHLILSTRDRLVIAHSCQILAKASGLHPLLREITELSQAAKVTTKIDANLLPTSFGSLVKQESFISLPTYKSHWAIAPKLFDPRHKESASSIENLILKPQNYVLKYAAKLRQASWQTDLGDDNIKGKMVHFFFEKFVEAIRSGTVFDPTSSFKPWIDQHFAQIVAERAYMFLADSQKLQLDRLKTEIERGLKIFHAEILDVDADKVYSEYALDTSRGEWGNRQIWTEVSGDILKVPGIRPHLIGSVDLYWTDKSGRTKILDIKWSRSKNKYQRVLKENKQIQIAIYSALLKTGSWPSAGYLTLPNATVRSLAHDQGAFKDPQFSVRSIESEHPTSALWSDVQKLWVWRWSQFQDGLIQVTAGPLPSAEDLHPSFVIPDGLSFDLDGEQTDYDYAKLLTGTGRKAG